MYRTTFDVLTRAAALLSFLVCSISFAAPAASPAKVDPRVWQDTENGNTASFILLLTEQTDSKAKAKVMADPKEKRRSIVAGLRETAERSQTDLRALLRRAGVKHRPYWVANLIVVEGSRGLVESLANRADVKAIEANHLFHVRLEQPAITSLAAPQQTTATAASEPNLGKIKATNLWALGFTGQGIVYANADTGVQWDHPALKSHYRGWNGSAVDHNYNWWDAIHNDINGDGGNLVGFNLRSPADDNGHGTHTMGIGIGDDGVGNQIGVAPGAKFICCRNMDEGTGRPSTYIECMQFLLAPTDLNGNNPDPDRGADVVGNSYTCPPDEFCAPDSLHAMLENMRAAGVFMAVAAGNDGSACSTIGDPPALDAAAITIGASDNSDLIADFSSRGPVIIDGGNRRKPDLVAPGVNVRSSVPPNGYGILSGTSMAAPHAAGAVALLWSAFPHIRGNVEYTQSILQQTAVHLTAGQTCGTNTGIPNNIFGFGRIDLLAAYNAVNRPPVAGDGVMSVPGDSASPLNLSGGDPEGAPLTFQIIQFPTNGLISAFSPSIGSLNYTPAHAFAGRDTIIFNVSDGTFTSSNASLQITVVRPSDLDHDGIPDYWELAHSLTYNDPSDAPLDPDHDNRTNFQEYIANTDPQSSNSVFRIVSAIRDPTGHNLITWSSVGGTRYRIQFVDGNPQSTGFHDLSRSVELEMDPHPIGSTQTMTFVDDFSLTGLPAAGSRYYRIRVVY